MMTESTRGQFACRAAAATLRALHPLVAASQAAAMVGGVWLSAHVSVWTVASLLFWVVGLYLAVRVYLDAELLELLATDPEGHPDELDQFLMRTGLRRQPVKRTIDDRCQGSLRLGKWLVLDFVAQVACLVAEIARGAF